MKNSVPNWENIGKRVSGKNGNWNSRSCMVLPIVYVFFGSLINTTLTQFIFKVIESFEDLLLKEIVEYAVNHAKLKEKYSKLRTPR